MKEIVKKDRGVAKRITFELLCPNGQLKQVVIQNDSQNDWGTFAAIILDESFLEMIEGENTVSTMKTLYANKKKNEDPFMPAMLVVNSDGKIEPFCGGHKSEVGLNKTIL